MKQFRTLDDVDVRGKDVRSEPALVNALPTPARDLIREFDDDGDGPGPTFAGDFECRVHREPGVGELDLQRRAARRERRRHRRDPHRRAA